MTNSNILSKPSSVSFKEIKERLLQNEEVSLEYEKLNARYQVISQIIEIRKQLKMTQSELAHRIGTSKSNISRLESGLYNPSLEFLDKIAKGLGKEIHIDLR
jgi:DNA-binding XRE family transcriptional regulator